MSVDPQLRALDIDIPAQPDVLVKLSLLLADEQLNTAALADLVQRDMALAAGVLRAVNSSLYGLAGRVQSVQQAASYLGMREVSAIVLELGLRAAFPPSPELEPIWARAGQRGLLMGRLAAALGLDAWAAHSAGLFEECGKAVLCKHAPEPYRAMPRATDNDGDLCQLEYAGFGVTHDALGAALCESWGLAPAAVASVRHHVVAQGLLELPQPPVQRAVLALSVVAQVMMNLPAAVDDVVPLVAPQADLDTTLVLRAARRLGEQLADRAWEARAA